MIGLFGDDPNDLIEGKAAAVYAVCLSAPAIPAIDTGGDKGLGRFYSLDEPFPRFGS